MQWMKWGRVVIIAACAVFLTTAGYAQAVYGTIFGSVVDNTGAAIPGATISITDTNKGTTVTATANEAGEFTVGHLIPDTYDVKVTFAGFSTFESKGLIVYADQSIKVEAKMEVGAATQTVEVSAATVEQLKTDRADVSTTFTAEDVRLFRSAIATSRTCSFCCRARSSLAGATLPTKIRRAANRSRLMARRSAVSLSSWMARTIRTRFSESSLSIRTLTRCPRPRSPRRTSTLSSARRCRRL